MRNPIQVLAGTALLGAALLLPGAGAAEGSRALELGTVNGGSCPVAADQSKNRAQRMARIEEQLRAAGGESAGDVKVLNGRGYRYDDDRVPDIAHQLDVLEIELQRARAAAKAQRQGQ